MFGTKHGSATHSLINLRGSNKSESKYKINEPFITNSSSLHCLSPPFTQTPSFSFISPSLSSMFNDNQYCIPGDEDSVVLRLGPPGQQYPNNHKPTSTKPSPNHEIDHNLPLTNPNDVTVALHIGPPVSEKETSGDNHEGLTARQGQYWIPSLSQILVGPTQFSCSVCNKTFNRFNNMQV